MRETTSFPYSPRHVAEWIIRDAACFSIQWRQLGDFPEGSHPQPRRGYAFLRDHLAHADDIAISVMMAVGHGRHGAHAQSDIAVEAGRVAYLAIGADVYGASHYVSLGKLLLRVLDEMESD